jgi:DNA-binding NarL/FixJ family response regulator
MGLKALLANRQGVEVVGEASTGREALTVVERLHPDVVLMDVSMPDLNGIEATAKLADTHPAVRVIIVSSHDDEVLVKRALKASAKGYLLKTASPQELEAAISSVMRGNVYLSPLVGNYLAKWAVQPLSEHDDPLSRLSPRQREVLQLIAEGRSTKEIAGQLGLGVSTIDSHRTELMRRLDIHDVAGLVRFAFAAGLLRGSSMERDS